MEGRLTISRPSYSDGRKRVIITIEDYDASVTLVTVEVGLEEFASALTGLAYQPVELHLGPVERFGKKKVRSTMHIEIPSGTSFNERKEVAKRIAEEKAKAEGWEVVGSLESQGSFYRKDGKEMAEVPLAKWIRKRQRKLNGKT